MTPTGSMLALAPGTGPAPGTGANTAPGTHPTPEHLYAPGSAFARARDGYWIKRITSTGPGQEIIELLPATALNTATALA